MIKHSFVIILSSIVLSGCVALFSPKRQKVTINTESGAEVFFKGTSYGKNSVVMKFEKSKKVEEVVIKKAGYLDKNYPIMVQRKNPLRFANLIGVPTIYGIYIYAFDANGNKAYLYPKVNTVTKLTPEPVKRQENEKFLYLHNTSIGIAKKDTFLIQYNTYKNFLKKKVYTTNTYDKNIEHQNTIFSDDLTNQLEKYNFIDTTETIFTNFANTLYLNSKINSLKMNYITPTKYAVGNGMSRIEAEIEWEVLDYYQVQLKTFKTKAFSDFYANDKSIDADSSSSYFKHILKNAIEHNLVSLLKNPEFKSLLPKGNELAESKLELITIRKASSKSKSLNHLIKSAVTVKTKNGHGSGFIISENGYIVTNYHVVAGNDKVDVILNDGTVLTGTILRKNSDFDLALVKIDRSGLLPLQIIDNDEEPELGTQATTIGTPKSVELGQSVSKGIISGIRNANNIKYIQTDLSVNSGNSGGALLDRDGKVIGVVTAKLQGFGVEGIGFAIPSHLIFQKLNLKYE